MGRSKGTLSLSGNIESQYSGPVDAKDITSTIAGLTDPATWLANDGQSYVYVGMKTVITADPDEANNGKMFVLKKLPFTDIANWKELGSGGGTGTVENVTLNGETIDPVDGTIPLGNLAVVDEADPYVKESTTGDLTTLTTTAKDDLVTAINEVNDKPVGISDIPSTPVGTSYVRNINTEGAVSWQSADFEPSGTVGDLSTLTTTDKSNVVAAINEVNDKPAYEEVPEGADVRYVRGRNAEDIAVWEEANFEPAGNVGDLFELTTADKSSTVAAINEVNAKPVGISDVVSGAGKAYVRSRNVEDIAVWEEADFANASDLGDIATLTTANKSSTVAAINEVNAKIPSGSGIPDVPETPVDTSYVRNRNELGAVEWKEANFEPVGNVGDLTTLTTTDKTSTVAAINEVNAKPVGISDVASGAGKAYVRSRNVEDIAVWEEADFVEPSELGDLATLTTTDKTSTVAAINEVNAKPAYEEVPEGADTTYVRSRNSEDVAVWESVNYADAVELGDVETLTTVDKSSAVAAINEVNAKPAYEEVPEGADLLYVRARNSENEAIWTEADFVEPSELGDLTTLTTTDKTSTVAAINEVNAKPTYVEVPEGADTTYVRSRNSEDVAVWESVNYADAADLGDITTLTTANKSSTVAAINEVNAKIPSGSGIPDVPETPVGTSYVRTRNDLGAVEWEEADYVNGIELGDLTTLTTTDKTSTVAAINEVNAKPVYEEVPEGADVKYLRSRNAEDVAVWEEADFEPAGNVGDLAALSTTDKTSTVAAINEVNAKPAYIEVPEGADTSYVRARNSEDEAVWKQADFAQMSDIGLLESLTTTDKTNIVSAVNEVNAKPSGVADVPTGADTMYVRSRNTEDIAVWEEADFEPSGNVGDLAALTTTDKTSTVAAINEVNAKPVYAEVPGGANKAYVRSRNVEDIAVWEEADFVEPSELGDLTTLSTTDKTSAVAAINEVNAKPSGVSDVPTGADTKYLRSRNAEDIAVWEEADFVEPSELGDLTTLTTTDKSSTVAAINEVNAKPVGISDVASGASKAYVRSRNAEDIAVWEEVNYADADDLGDITTLTTTDKTSVVAAVNEVNAAKISSVKIEGKETPIPVVDGVLTLPATDLTIYYTDGSTKVVKAVFTDAT